MATLTRQVDRSADDAGEVGVPGDAVLASLPGDGSWDVTQDIQDRIDATPNGGTLLFPPGRTFWVQGGIQALNRTNLTIDFNDCTIYRKKEFNAVKATLTIGITATDLSFEISPLAAPGFVTSSGGNLTGNTGWLSGIVGLGLTYDAWIGTGAYDSNRERVTVTSVVPSTGGKAIITLTSRGPAGPPPPGPYTGITRQAWPATTQLEMIEKNNWWITKMNGGTNVTFRNLNVVGPSTATLPDGQVISSGGDRRESQSALEIGGTANFIVDEFSARGVYGDGIFFADGEPYGRVVSSGPIKNIGRQAMSFRDRSEGIRSDGGKGMLIEGRPGGARFVIGDITQPRANNTIRNSEMDIEPYVDRAATTNVTFRHMHFAQGGQFQSKGNGDEVTDIVIDDCTFAGGLGMNFGVKETQEDHRRKRITINNCVWVNPAAVIGLGGQTSGIRLYCCDDIVFTNNTVRFDQSIGRDVMYAMWLEDCTVKLMSGNTYEHALAAAAIVFRESTGGQANYKWKVGEIGLGDYPVSYRATPVRGTAGRPFTGDIYSPIPHALTLGVPKMAVDTSGPTMAPINDQSLLTNGGDGGTGPQIFFQSAPTYVNKNTVAMYHGGSAYRNPPAGDPGAGQDQSDWGDPFLNETIPLPPRPIPGGQWPGPNTNDWWAVVVDLARQRTYEYINAHWVGTVFACDWAACYALNGDGRTTVTGSGKGSGSGISQVFGILREHELEGEGFPDHPLVFVSNRVRGPKDQPTSPRRWPARSTDGNNAQTSSSYLPEGTRIRLAYKKKNGSRLGADSWTDRRHLKIAWALRNYGAYLIDQGGNPAKIAFPAEHKLLSGNDVIAAGPLPFEPDEDFDILGHWDGTPWNGNFLGSVGSASAMINVPNTGGSDPGGAVGRGDFVIRTDYTPDRYFQVIAVPYNDTSSWTDRGTGDLRLRQTDLGEK